MLQTPICEMFGTKYPIWLAGMGGVSMAPLAAGGIVDGRGVVAALPLGAQGAVTGTRFIASPESTAARSYREAILKATGDSTVRTRCYTGKPARTIRNPHVAELESDPSRTQPFPQQVIHSSQAGVMDYMGRRGDADPSRTFMPAGQGSRPAAEIMERIVREAEQIVSERLLRALPPERPTSDT